MSTVARQEQPITLDPLAKAAFRKVIWRLMPILTLGFVLNYLDRTNIGFAALTMNHDLGLSNVAFGWGAGILFFGYCAFEVPSNWAMYKVGARLWLARIMITWGLLSGATALISSANQFYILRFFLGIAEAGFVPGAMFYLALWFPPHYRSRILSWFQMSVPLASLISGPLSTVILQLNGVAGLAGWQWLFITEGIPCTILGILMLFMLTDSPASAKWLSDSERTAVLQAVAAEHKPRAVHGFWSALKDTRVLLLAGIQFGFTIGSYGVAIWLPLILKGHDLTNTEIGWLAALPYLCGCVATVLWSGHVDRTGKRITNLVLACLVGAVGLIWSVLFGSLAAAVLGICVALIGITAARGIFWSIPPRFLQGMAAAGGLALINSIGTFGGFVGPMVMGWLRDLTGSFSIGLLLMASLMAASALLTLVLRLVLERE
jgi:ACS family tartrate transporter-like MFS transporter